MRKLNWSNIFLNELNKKTKRVGGVLGRTRAGLGSTFEACAGLSSRWLPNRIHTWALQLKSLSLQVWCMTLSCRSTSACVETPTHTPNTPDASRASGLGCRRRACAASVRWDRNTGLICFWCTGIDLYHWNSACDTNMIDFVLPFYWEISHKNHLMLSSPDTDRSPMFLASGLVGII